MRKRSIPLVALALIAAGPAPGAPPPGEAGTLFATVGQSEWCPPGTVWVDLSTGRYQLTPANPRGCRSAGYQRRVRAGTISERQRAQLLPPFRAALAEGVDACKPGERPGRIVVSNGGPFALVVSGPNSTLVAPAELGCWSEAASRLHEALQRVFAPEGL